MLGQVELDELLSGREKINRQLQSILDQQTDPWGIKISAVEVKHEQGTRVPAAALPADADRDRRGKELDVDTPAPAFVSCAHDPPASSPSQLHMYPGDPCAWDPWISITACSWLRWRP
jgi:hypothetical protein